MFEAVWYLDDLYVHSQILDPWLLLSEDHPDYDLDFRDEVCVFQRRSFSSSSFCFCISFGSNCQAVPTDSLQMYGLLLVCVFFVFLVVLGWL